MKYGRDSQAHTISKNTVLYRTSVNSNSDDSTHLYVTYTDVDRSLYKGSYSKTLAKNQSGNPNNPVYEKSYRLKEDLRVPSKETVNKIVQQMAKDSKIVKAVAEAQKGAWFMQNWLSDSAANSYADKITEAGTEWNDSDYQKEVTRVGNKWVSDHIKQFGSMSTDDIFRETVQSFGSSKQNRDRIIAELKKQGYNAMVDEAGVGTATAPEGIEPLIIFDKDSSVEQVSSQRITERDIIKADKTYSKWQQRARQQARGRDWFEQFKYVKQ